METRRRWNNIIEDILVQSTWDRTQICAAHCTAVSADCKCGRQSLVHIDGQTHNQGHLGIQVQKLKILKPLSGLYFCLIKS